MGQYEGDAHLVGVPVAEVDIIKLYPNATLRNATILDEYPEYYFFKLALNVPLGVLILVGNALTIHAIRRFPSLQTVTNVFIQSLSTADILNAFPIMMVRFLIFIEDQYWSNVVHMIFFGFG